MFHLEEKLWDEEAELYYYRQTRQKTVIDDNRYPKYLLWEDILYIIVFSVVFGVLTALISVDYLYPLWG